MISRSLWRALTLALVAPSLFFSAPLAQAQESPGTFVDGECMFEVPEGLAESLECGYLTVPARHSDPDGPTIELAVAIVRSSGESPAPEPLVLLQGGPGGSTIDTYIQVLGYGQLSELRERYDLILFDQRGTLYSRPALVCTEMLALTEETIERRVPRDESYRLSLDATRACRERLLAEGVDLSIYNSLENAADVDLLRESLGYDQINLYGVSYGTLLALHVMRDYPEGLRSVILDAVVPTQTNFITDVPQSQDRAFSELFAACRADRACDAAYPNLEQVFFELVERYNREPARVPMTDPETKKTYQAVVDGDTLQSLTFQLLYASEIIPALPHVIYRMQAGDFSFISQVAPQIVFDRTMSYGMYDSVICAEDADFEPGSVAIEGVRPEFAEYAEEDAQSMLDTCALWDVPELDAPVDRPVESDIPTLVLNGRFDPITPPANGEEAARTLSRSYVFTFGDTGHSAATAGECPESIIIQFLDEPAQRPDGSCIDARPAPSFLTPETVRFAPGIGRILNELNTGNFATLLLPIVCLVLLLSIFAVWPLALIIRAVRNKPGPPMPGLAGLANWALLLAAVVGSVCVVGLFALVFRLATSGEELVLLFGVPVADGWLLALPWVVAVLAALAALGTAAAWQRGWWTLPGRIYHSLMVLAALGLAIGLMPFVG